MSVYSIPMDGETLNATMPKTFIWDTVLFCFFIKPDTRMDFTTFNKICLFNISYVFYMYSKAYNTNDSISFILFSEFKRYHTCNI